MPKMIKSDSVPAGSEALALIANAPGAVGLVVTEYSTRPEDNGQAAWLDKWFADRATKLFSQTLADTEKVVPLGETGGLVESPAKANGITITRLDAHYFRGFRQLARPVALDGDLVVVEGKNSAGKTSFAEALEFLFSGRLSRREGQVEGNSRELENCISNQLRPQGEQTWVSARFLEKGEKADKEFVLRRVLKEDYGPTSTSRCTSAFYVDDKELRPDQEISFLNTLFGSVPPLLMQHTLRFFVQGRPDQRRGYFESLLRVDNLTDLISKAVVGDARLPEFKSPTASIALTDWQGLAALVKKTETRRAMERFSRGMGAQPLEKLAEVLALVAKSEFGYDESDDFQQTQKWVEGLQTESRQRSFPLLTRFRAARQPADVRLIGDSDIQTGSTNIRTTWTTYKKASQAIQSLGRAQVLLAEVLQSLEDSGGLDASHDMQTCPLCLFQEAPTLSSGRLSELRTFSPARHVEREAKTLFEAGVKAVQSRVTMLVQDVVQTLPTLPDTEIIAKSLISTSEDIRTSVGILVSLKNHVDQELQPHITEAKRLSLDKAAVVDSDMACEQLVASFEATLRGLSASQDHARKYQEAYQRVEAAVGKVASGEPEYRLRELWLTCGRKIPDVVEDLRWESCKRQAQKDLEGVREILIQFRTKYLEARRALFSAGMQEIWSTLRDDTYSVFSQLNIPEPKGKGFQVVMEVKAILDDGVVKTEVDALKIFSESQVNALGIAAFITRSKLLGHKLLIFDDPVQSMDEDHFKTFARDVLPPLMEQGFQVLVLTHNDTFARDISYWHHARPGYVTMEVRHSRREGCQVDEGNRRVHERLKKAKQLIEEGKPQEAWRLVRLAIERLYLIAYITHGPKDFDPDVWRKQPAEYMWDSGVGAVITVKLPEAGKRLKEILDMTVAGAHDVAGRGTTELNNAVKYLGSLSSKLSIGG